MSTRVYVEVFQGVLGLWFWLEVTTMMTPWPVRV